MQPRVFIDFRVRASATLPLPAAASKTLAALHKTFVERPGLFALGLPDAPEQGLRCLRVFASQASELESLAFRVRDAPARISDVVTVPEDYAGPWVRYKRFRISTRKNDVSGPWLKAGKPTDERAFAKPEGMLRERRIRQAMEAQWPYFEVHSASTGQHFRLIVEPIAADGPLTETVEPDSYGLSVTTRPFALPADRLPHRPFS